MTSQLFDQVASIPGYGVAAAALIIVVILFRPSRLDAIPTVGPSSWLGSSWASFEYLPNALDLIQEGYEKHKSAPFKVAELYRWVVVLGSRKHVEEVRKAPDDVLSLSEAINEQLNMEYTMGPELHHNPYHVPLINSQLNREIGAMYPEIRNEIVTAFDDVLDLRGNEWKSVPVASSVQKVVCRTSNRVFVGLPLCRDPDWIDLNIRYTFDVAKGGAILTLFPQFLKPVAARLFTNTQQNNERGRKLLGPIIKARQQSINEYGNEWADKPNDFLSWLMAEAEGSELTVKCLTARIFSLNFAAIHTSAQSVTQTLFYLAANPQYIQPLREEVESILQKEGWSKAALGKMRKVDSFMKECERLQGVSSVSMRRKVMKDFTFSDGTFVSKGTMVIAAARSMHRDEAFYENATAFEPFRFADLREEDGEGVKHQYASTTAEYLAFGHGRHACPGRFFAATEIKSMLAHVVVTYDVKLADNAAAAIPDPRAEVMFRRRVD